MTKIRLLMVAALTAVYAVSAGAAEKFPGKPVRIIVPFAAGGPNDFVSRLFGQRLSDIWDQPVVVDNRAGAGGNIGAELAKRSAPDGYTLVLHSTAFVVNPSLYRKVPYDVFKDFAPVTLAATSALIFVAHPSLPARSMRDVVALAKSSPSFNYASPGTGTLGHLGAELFSSMAGIKMQHIPYKGAAPAVIDLLGGQVKFGMPAVPPVVPHLRTGKLVGLGVTSLQRLALLPEVPTVVESGYPGYRVDNMYGVLAPAGTPAARIRELNSAIVKVLAVPEIREKLSAQGFDVVGNSPQEFASFLKVEFDKWGKAVKESGAKVD